jgi:hypothetical protein
VYTREKEGLRKADGILMKWSILFGILAEEKVLIPPEVTELAQKGLALRAE